VESESYAYPDLRFLSDESEIRELRNRLPHWQLDQTACFVTFRLNDSLPADVLKNWSKERDLWLAKHPKPWSEATEHEYHKRFATRIDQFLDAGHGSCVLARPECAELLSATLMLRDKLEYLLHSWVIMPNHVHALFSPAGGNSLSRIVGGWKRFSATKINKATGDFGSLWQKDYFDRLIRSWDHFMAVARYTRRNPAKAGLSDGSYACYESPWIRRLLS
jgi:type I restriction enzyme R subunit